MRPPDKPEDRVRLFNALDQLSANAHFQTVLHFSRIAMAEHDRALRRTAGEELHRRQGRALEHEEFLDLCATARTRLAEVQAALARKEP